MIPYILKPNDSKTLSNCLRHIAEMNPSKTWEVEIREQKRKRSLPQNRLYWQYLNIIEAETGHLAEELHEFFKMDILGFKDVTFKGRTMPVPVSTTSLTTKGFTDYINEIQARVGAYGITLPSPSHWGYE